MVATSTGQFDYHTTASCRGKVVPIIVLALPPPMKRATARAARR